jgi:hypothetical protein
MLYYARKRSSAVNVFNEFKTLRLPLVLGSTHIARIHDSLTLDELRASLEYIKI